MIGKTELIDKLEKAAVGSAELDAKLYLLSEIQMSAENQRKWNAPIPLPEYALRSVDWHGFQFTRNLAAAVKLVPAHCAYEIRKALTYSCEATVYGQDTHADVQAATVELAICIAALKARTTPPAPASTPVKEG